MSKLFKTLEKIQIRDNAAPEQEKVVTEKPIPSQPTRSRVFPFLVGMTVMVAFFAGFQFFSSHTRHKTQPMNNQNLPGQTQASSLIAQKMIPSSPINKPGTENTKENIISFNNKGVKLAREGKFWQAIYSFDQAVHLMPNQNEPAINMGITLAHIGLQFPAQRYFAKAYTITPDNSHLLQAMDTAMANKQISSDFLISLQQQEME